MQQGKGGGLCGADKDSGEAAEGLGPVSCVQRQFKQELKLGAKTADKGPQVKRGRGGMSLQTGNEKGK